ncbi:MAG TPA: acyl-CoA dehydrogenase family protein [Mycobacteriales bacterium]|nr:acyl-CoA dehydrogenase family protein [Mycobacteriales bacterium]
MASRSELLDRELRRAVRQVARRGRSDGDRCWRELAGLGALAAGVPVDAGGLDLGLAAAGGYCEALGRELAAPLLLDTMTAADLLAGAAARHRPLLDRVIAGERKIALALDAQLAAAELDGGWLVDGEAPFVTGADRADLFLLAAAGELWLVPADRPGCAVRPHVAAPTAGLHALRLNRLRLAPADALGHADPGPPTGPADGSAREPGSRPADGAAPEPGSRPADGSAPEPGSRPADGAAREPGSGPAAGQAPDPGGEPGAGQPAPLPDRVRARARARRAGYLVGLAAGGHDRTVQHVRGRRQFDRPLGDNQSVAFGLAELAVRVEATRRMVRHAGWLDDAGRPALLAATEAAAAAAELALDTTRAGVHLHGAFGTTDAASIAGYYRHAAVEALRDGGPARLWREAGRLRLAAAAR